MSLDLEDLFIDEDVSKEGVWVPFYSDSELLIGSTDSNRYKSKLSRLARQHRVSLDDSNPKAFEVIQQITAEALAAEVLFGWKGIKMNGVENIPYTPALGKDALLRSAKLREFLTDRGADVSLFKKDLIEKGKKPSAGA